MEFAITSYTVGEGDSFVSLELVKWGETSDDIVLIFTLGMEGDSAEGMDGVSDTYYCMLAGTTKVASYPGLPSQLFSQPWQKAWLRPGSKRHVMRAIAYVSCSAWD